MVFQNCWVMWNCPCGQLFSKSLYVNQIFKVLTVRGQEFILPVQKAIQCFCLYVRITFIKNPGNKLSIRTQFMTQKTHKFICRPQQHIYNYLFADLLVSTSWRNLLWYNDLALCINLNKFNHSFRIAFHCLPLHFSGVYESALQKSVQKRYQ